MLLLSLLSVLSAAHAETLFVTAATPAARWADDASTVTATLEVGDAVEVVLRDGAKVRVRKGGDFGWVDATVLAPEAPARPIELAVPGLPNP